jgi:regulator of sirC expression with transglutaminase-like and TPR domain
LLSLEQQVVDPLSLRTLGLQQLGAKLTAQQQQEIMQPTPTSVFGLRMLNNVKIQYAQAQNWFEVLDILECQLMVETLDQSAQAALQFERGECLLQMEQQSRAQQAYMTCLEMSPPPVLAQQVEQRLQQLRQQQKILH